MSRPGVLERLRRAPGALPLVLGHRGARYAEPENTYAAFELARIEGAAGVELDVRLVKTGEIVVAHDPELTRVTSGQDKRKVENLTLEEVLRADLGKGQRVPKLTDLLDWAHRYSLLLNVEVKADVKRRRDLVTGVTQLLARHPYAPRGVVLSSFDPRFVWGLARALPNIPCAFLFHKKSPIAHAAALVGAATFKRLGAQAAHPEHVLVNAKLMSAYHSRKALVGVWTVNDEERAKTLAKLGVDYIISDRPGAILAALKSA